MAKFKGRRAHRAYQYRLNGVQKRQERKRNAAAHEQQVMATLKRAAELEKTEKAG